MTRVANDIRRGLTQALAFAKSGGRLPGYRVHVIVNVRAIRKRLGLSQQEFARRFGFSVRTLRDWEQGRRIPEGANRAYLTVIARMAKAVERALRAA